MGKIGPKFSHLLTVRAEGAAPPPYGQPDRKKTVFFLRPPLTNHLMVENHSMLEGAEEELEQPCDQPVEPQREDAGENLEARHIFPQWTQLLPAHNHQVNFFQDRLCSQIIFPLWLI